jgi:Kef-type K+ transport system membrane component KefB
MGAIAGGAILALAALIVLLQALVIAIAEMGVPPALAALIVGLVVAAIAYFMIHKGTNDLKASSLAPDRTMDSLRRDAQLVKEQAQ